MSAEQERFDRLQRLSLSRQALIAQLHDGEHHLPAEAEDASRRRRLHDGQAGRQQPWNTVIRHVMQRWWRRHPANAATQLARPLLDRYAREQPAKLVVAAAATGALIVLVKPWRLLPATAVLAALLKSSDVADLVTTLTQKTANPRKDARAPSPAPATARGVTTSSSC